ncbi:MAG TPA: NAD(P)H-binding protein [Longimicrobiales bacterium]|nr:NAD(P)H-binding protein [Longimicrobiales bacterium]
MKVVLFGASGMIGQGALRECLNDPQVNEVLAVVRKPSGVKHAKLRELIHSDFTDYAAIGTQLNGYDACLFCLGTSSAGMSEAEYKVITYDYTLAAARILIQRNPALTFIYISGEGADPTEQGRVMWARVRGKAENDLLKLSDKVYIIRPAVIQPLHGIEARQRWTRILYKVTGPLIPLLRAALPRYVTDTERLGRAMLNIARRGASKRILHTPDVNAIA